MLFPRLGSGRRTGMRVEKKEDEEPKRSFRLVYEHARRKY